MRRLVYVGEPRALDKSEDESKKRRTRGGDFIYILEPGECEAGLRGRWSPRPGKLRCVINPSKWTYTDKHAAVACKRQVAYPRAPRARAWANKGVWPSSRGWLVHRLCLSVLGVYGKLAVQPYGKSLSARRAFPSSSCLGRGNACPRFEKMATWFGENMSERVINRVHADETSPDSIYQR